jgi:hypothetical protein
MWKSRLVLLIAWGLVLTPLYSQPEERHEVTVEGILTRVAGIGSESTGWAIRLDASISVEGKPVKSIEVAGPNQEFRRLENMHVDAVGNIVIRHGVERGAWPVLEISSIHEAKPK